MQPTDESTRTPVQHWRRTIRAFAREFNRMKCELADRYEEQLASVILKAIQVLCTIPHSDKASPSVQLLAALAVFKMMPRPEPVAQPLPEPEIQEVKALPPALVPENSKSCTILHKRLRSRTLVKVLSIKAVRREMRNSGPRAKRN